jgi:thiamine-monophosphate kinase
MSIPVKELQLISKIRGSVPGKGKDLDRGIGDDCSVFGRRGEGRWMVSTDMLVDNVHFNRSWHDPHLLGRKCIAVNLSDIAAMGGVPRFILISACLSEEITENWISSWYEGVQEIIAEHGCLLIGGDTVLGKEVNFSITVLGECIGENPIYRNGAQVGDGVFVSGELGSSAAGLELCRKLDGSMNIAGLPYLPFINAHLDPIPQVELGQILAKTGMVSAMQDISDGLATDLGHIVKESGVQARISETLLPVSTKLSEISNYLDVNILDLALRGGEDYQLVFTIKKEALDSFECSVDNLEIQNVTRIGTITGGSGVVLEDKEEQFSDISFSGYEHS